MNILVISDSHNDRAPVRKLLDIYKGQVDMAFHLGDGAADLMGFASDYPAIGMRAVAGNCDPWSPYKQELLLDIQGRGVLLLHGHRANVKFGYDRLIYYAREAGAAACLFGHTHEPVIFDREGVFFLNPGSVAVPNFGRKPSYALLSVSENGVFKGVQMSL